MKKKNMLSIGFNKKLSRKKMEKEGIASFNIPAGKYCFYSTTMCQKYCYAKRAERYLNVRNFRENNFKETLKNGFVENMVKEIERRKVKYLRIHESGDFYNYDYFTKWISIIQICSGTKFLVFTKNTEIVYYLALLGKNIPKNLNIFISSFPDSNQKEIEKASIVNYYLSLPIAYTVQDKTCIDNYKGYLCKGKCYDCMHCFNNHENVIFLLH